MRRQGEEISNLEHPLDAGRNLGVNQLRVCNICILRPCREKTEDSWNQKSE